MDSNLASLRSLTALRFFAAFGVFAHHATGVWSGVPPFAGVVPRVLFEGFAGVSFFFVLSGFILTYNYAGRLEAPTGAAVRRFYAARFARVYPLHLLTFAAAVPLVAAQFADRPGRGLRYAAAQLTLTQSFVPRMDCYFGFNAVSWSLSVEAFFYLCFPALIWAAIRSGVNRPSVAVAAVAVLCPVMTAVSWAGLHSPLSHWLCAIFPVTRLLDFGLGILLCFAWQGLRRTTVGRCSRVSGTCLELLAVAVLGTAVYFAPAVPMVMRTAGYYPVPMALVILVFSLQRGYLSAVLMRPALVYLGEISFSFYMVHMLAFHYLDPSRRAWGDGPSAAFVTTGYWLAGTTVLSAIAYEGFEKPMRDRVRRWLARGDVSRPHDLTTAYPDSSAPESTSLVRAA